MIPDNASNSVVGGGGKNSRCAALRRRGGSTFQMMENRPGKGRGRAETRSYALAQLSLGDDRVKDLKMELPLVQPFLAARSFFPRFFRCRTLAQLNIVSHEKSVFNRDGTRDCGKAGIGNNADPDCIVLQR